MDKKLLDNMVTLGAVEGAIDLKQAELKTIRKQKSALHAQELITKDFIEYARGMVSHLRKNADMDDIGANKVKVAVCGGMRSGKDTVADYLVERFGFEKFRFGDGIREVGKIAFPEEFNGKQKPRKKLQDIGQYMRKVDPQVWVKYTLREIENSDARRVVISDLRQPNEYEALREAGFYIIRVEAPYEVRLRRAQESGDNFNPEHFNHETESHFDGFNVDYIITNDDYVSLQQLYQWTDEVFHHALVHRDTIKGAKGNADA